MILCRATNSTNLFREFLPQKRSRFLIEAYALLSLLVATHFVAGQVTITSLTPTGSLTWTNTAGRGMYTVPIYRIESANNAAGPWTFVSDTDQTFISITNALAGGPLSSFYRITWINGQAWSYEAYDDVGLIVTGKLYFLLRGPGPDWYIDGGSWEFAQAGLRGTGRHILGSGSFLSLDPHFIYFPTPFDDQFYLSSNTYLSDAWSGQWAWSGFADFVWGRFTAERIVN